MGGNCRPPETAHDCHIFVTRKRTRGSRTPCDARELGRGPGDSRQSNNEHGHDPRDDARWLDRDREPRDRTFDPREPFTRDLDLPRGLEREIVRDRDREYTLRGSETRTLATVGAFRVVSSRDLRDHHDRPADPRSGDLRHLREQGLIIRGRSRLGSARPRRRTDEGRRCSAFLASRVCKSCAECARFEHRKCGV